MESALGGADFEWSKTGDIRTEYMEQEDQVCDSKEKFGNDFDLIEERSLRNLMGSALGGADFEWSKTGDIRTEYMEQEEQDSDN